jgi:hypothetical protein
MKKILTLVFALGVFGANAQITENLYLDFNVGTRLGGTHSELTELGAGLNLNGAIGYQINDMFAVRGGLAFDTYNAQLIVGSGRDRSLLTRLSLEGVLNVAEVADFMPEPFGLLFHAGFGFGTNSNADFKEKYVGEFTDRGLKGNDDTFNIMFGLNPKYNINDNIAINLDLTYALLIGQAHYVDRKFDNSYVKGTGGLFTMSVGVTYKFGSSAE